MPDYDSSATVGVDGLDDHGGVCCGRRNLHCAPPADRHGQVISHSRGHDGQQKFVGGIDCSTGPPRFDSEPGKPLKRAFPATIMNANPDMTGVNWSAQTDVPWQSLSRNRGIGNTTFTRIADPKQLALTKDLNGDVFLDSTTGNMAVRSGLYDQQVDDPVTLTVTLRFAPTGGLSVRPEQIVWSIEKADEKYGHSVPAA